MKTLCGSFRGQTTASYGWLDTSQDVALVILNVICPLKLKNTKSHWLVSNRHYKVEKYATWCYIQIMF